MRIDRPRWSMLLPAIAAAWLCGCAGAGSSRTHLQDYSADTKGRIESLFARFDGDVPGCAVGVFEHNGRRYTRGFGMADVRTRTPLSEKSLFAIASVSKQFTALSLLLLVQDGKLSLSDSVRRTVPELPPSYEPITLRHLLLHTSGLPEYEDIYNQQGGPDYDSATRADQLRVIVNSVAPMSPPGTAWKYANTNYLLAAVVVERVSGQSLRDFARRRIFGPLHMRSTDFVAAKEEVRPLRAFPYQPDAEEHWQTVLYGAHAGPTGVQTTLVDLQKWSENFYRPIVGTRDVLAEMQQSQSLADGTPITAALGLERKRLGNQDAILHTGVTAGTRAAFVRFPAHNTTIVLLCNRMDVNTERLATQMAAVLFE